MHHQLQFSAVVSAGRSCRGGIFGTSRDEGTKTLEGNLLLEEFEGDRKRVCEKVLKSSNSALAMNGGADA